MLDFLSPVSVIPGMGPKREEAMRESGLETIGDLLYHLPLRYIDRSEVTELASIERYLQNTCTVTGIIERVRFERGRRPRFRVQIQDGSGSLELLWFQGIQYVRTRFVPGVKLLVTGKVGFFGHYQMVHPMVEILQEEKELIEYKFIPHYSLTSAMRDAGIQQKFLHKTIGWVLKNLQHYPQVLPDRLESKRNFPPLSFCLKELHHPSDLSGLSRYKERLKYEELYVMALTLRWSKRTFTLPGRSMHAGELNKRFSKQLPFTLTSEQQKAITVLYNDAAQTKRMHRLLQGDVGSGKTLVAFFACLPALNETLQVAWLAPTEVLANQTFTTVASWLAPLGYTAALLTGSTSVSSRKSILNRLSSGEIQFLVGTHALLQPSVQFKSLGMTIIDEQHKFGARQRLALQEKDTASDFLLMSATPIPQTLAMTLYGDLDLVTLLHGPQGREPVSTHIVPESKRSDMERFIVQQINATGCRVFYVVPRIEREDEHEDLGMKDVESTFAALTGGVFSTVAVGYVHGKMSSPEKESVMKQFVQGDIRILVATSVVEVGIDIPEATIIVIENAEQFGLAQLHQLRGRVGRGGGKAYCFLLPAIEGDEQSKERLTMFCRNHDGFKIADMDLRYRGPGEISGFRQSGWGDMKMADILEDADLFREIQHELEKTLSS